MSDSRYELSTETVLRVNVVQPSWLDDLKIRLLVQADLPALEWDGEYIHYRRLYGDIFQSVRLGRALMWGADIPLDGIIGQLFVQLRSKRKELADGKKRAYFYSFRVRPAFRSFGVGSRLLKTAEKDLVERGFSWITLNVAQTNYGARRFYERHGYQVVTAEPGRWSYRDHLGKNREVHEPAWRMEKQIAGS
jgi:ribosomal protein S18 acetylase RimI-like enzyme